jgi:L-asparaginase II
MKVATSATVFTDSVGVRLSVTYSVIDEKTGKIIEDNHRANKVITDADGKSVAQQMIQYAQDYIETLED